MGQTRSAHTASIFASEAEQHSSVVPFLLSGLDCGEKCVYILDSSDRDEVVDAVMRARDVQAHIDSGQVSFLSSDDTYLKGGRFDMNRMLGLLRESERSCLSEGYSGLRITGEMTWHCSNARGVDDLAEYEARVNGLYPESTASILCQYYEPSFGHDVLLDVIRTHPKLVVRGELCSNPYYLPLDEFLSVKGGQVPRKTYERTSHDILKRLHLSMLHRIEMRDFRRARCRLSILESAGLDEIDNLADVVSFYNELAMDSCENDVVKDYLSEVAKKCEAIHRHVRFAKMYGFVGEAEAGWRGLRSDVERATRDVDERRVIIDDGAEGVDILADDLFECAIRCVLENIPDIDSGSGDVAVSFHETESGLLLTIAHDGKGLPESAKGEIFACGNRYGQSDGYGLFLAKEILNHAGMSLRECGKPGVGTKFEIHIPADRCRPSASS